MYASSTDNKGQEAPLFSILAGIKNGKWSKQINALRMLLKNASNSHDPLNKEYDEAKRKLPAFTASGLFLPTRSKENLHSHSGFIVLDLDKAGITRHQLEPIPFVYAFHRSAGGTGWAVYVKVEADEADDHYRLADDLMAEMDRRKLPVDKSCKDPCRLRFISYDPTLHINENAKVYRIATPDAVSVETAIAELEDRQIELFDSYEQMRSIAWAFLGDFTPEQARSYFDRLVALSPKYASYPSSEIDRRWKEFIKQETKGPNAGRAAVTMGTFWYMVRQKGIKAKPYYNADAEKAAYRILSESGDADEAIQMLKREHKMDDAKAQALINRLASGREPAAACTFWNIEVDDKGRQKLVFSPSAFIAWLHNQGYWCFRSEGEKEFRRIRLAESILSDVTTAEMQHVALSFLHGLPFEVDGTIRPIIIDNFYRQIRSLFHPQILDTLPILEMRPLQDTPDTSYLCYQNCFVAVTKGHLARLPYSDLPGHVFQRQLISRKLANLQKDPPRSDFADFLEKCAAGDGNRYFQLRCSIGYLLHRYKTPSVPRVIIYQDEIQGEGSEQGGTGKGLIVKAISKMRPTVVEHGKQMDLSKSFAFQRVEPGTTAVFVIDDPKRTFRFEDVFNLATEGMVVERKNRDATYIPFEQSPKLVITSNYALSGLGASHRRRRLEVDISPYWSSERSPRDAYGRDLFSSWNEDEWASFDVLMMRCIQAYMASGLVDVPSEIREANRLAVNTEPSFPAWMDEYILAGYQNASEVPLGEGKLGERIEKKNMALDYAQAMGYDRPIHQNRWSIWLKAWCMARGVTLSELKPHAGGRCWQFDVVPPIH